MEGPAALNAFLKSGHYHDLLAIVKGFRNGAVYGGQYPVFVLFPDLVP